MNTITAMTDSIEIKAFEEMKNADRLLCYIDSLRLEASKKLKPENRASLGQFFTSASVARLMASMFSRESRVVNILDAGAGVGSLSSALLAEICNWNNRPKSITITAYEIDPVLVDYLRTSFDICLAAYENEDVNLSTKIYIEDFIEKSVSMLNGGLSNDTRMFFNYAIVNPPYRKIRINSRERKLLKRIGIETSNLYTAFLWIILKLLEPNGELVAIVPRSFCNGLYFLSFRKALLETMTIRRIHIFESRERTFKDDKVLQENIIIHAIKTSQKNPLVTISSSASPDEDLIATYCINHDYLVKPDDSQAIIHIIPNETALRIKEQIEMLTLTLNDIGLAVSTGRVVDFRAKEFLKEKMSDTAVPLIYPAHFMEGFIKWPNKMLRKPDALTEGAKNRGILIPTGFYVLVKRFSSKEEKRRIIAAVYDPSRLSTEMIGFENHLNYFHRNGHGMPRDLAKGLAAFLNSTPVDKFFRQFSGNTQVNATDLRNLRYPSEEKLLAIGTTIGERFPPQEELDILIEKEIGLQAIESICTPGRELPYRRR